MKTQKSIIPMVMFIMAIFFGIGTFTFAAQTEIEKPKTEALKEKTTKTVQVLKKYSVNQRDEALKKAKEVLDELDTQIDRLESDLNKKWDQLDQAARQKSQDALRTLRKQRNAVAEWYGGLKQSSGKAWEEVKRGFIKSYQDLRQAFQKARRAF